MELTREYYRTMFFYDCKAGLNQGKLAFGNEFPSRTTAISWCKEF